MQWFDEEEEERRRKGLLEGAISMPQEGPGPAPSDRLGRAITPPQQQQPQPPAKFAEVISAAKQVPSPAISSTGDPNSNGPLSDAIKDSDATVNKGTLATLSGGNLTNQWADVKTAHDELGSFSDSAGKWWSVLLAAMFPQYGSALNLIGNMKGNKYRAAMDKYESAYKSLRAPKHDVRNLDDGYYSIDGEIKRLPLDPKSVESEVRYGRTSTGRDVAVSMPRGSDPYHTVDDVDLPFGMGSAPEKVLTYDSRLWQQKLADEGKSGRIIEGKENQMELERVRAANREHLKMLSIQASKDLAWLRADLRTFAGQASAAAQAELENDIDFMVEQDPVKKKQMFETRATEKAALLKKIQQDEMSRLKGGGATPPAAQLPAAGKQTTPSTRKL